MKTEKEALDLYNRENRSDFKSLEELGAYLALNAVTKAIHNEEARNARNTARETSERIFPALKARRVKKEALNRGSL